jgi:hypothetical protein
MQPNRIGVSLYEFVDCEPFNRGRASNSLLLSTSENAHEVLLPESFGGFLLLRKFALSHAT